MSHEKFQSGNKYTTGLHNEGETSIKASQKLPKFIKKLLLMLNSAASTNIVTWGSQESGIFIRDVNEFTEKVLPLYFKKKNFYSFVRQVDLP